ncbi:MAG: response regulator [Lachnospiraceae bacterium]|nr:response regulator [Lachnospiraceae bacterium]
MYRIVLVDDEPLILAGIISLIRWEDYDCTIVGKATNGPKALELIREVLPDIVITDIRMPVMNGLELMEECRKQGYDFAFIILTNLEEFQLARKALSLGAVDYLVKLDLESEQLTAALTRAKSLCDQKESHQNRQLYDQLMRENAGQLEQNYFGQLLLGSGSESLPIPEGLPERYPHPLIIRFTMRPEHVQYKASEPYDFLFIRQQLTDILSGICSRYFQAFTILFLSAEQILLIASLKTADYSIPVLSEFCSKINGTLDIYFGLKAVFGICDAAEGFESLPEASGNARMAMEHYYYDSHSPVVFYNGQPLHEASDRDFNINLLKRSIANAVTQNNSSQLKSVFSDLTELFQEYHPGHSQAVSACINLYTYLNDLFLNEGNAYSHIFPDTLNIVEHVKQLGSLQDILIWLNSFGEQICMLLDERREKPLDKLVALTRQYVREHYREKLTLSDIAEHLNISPGHLSNTFRKYSDMTLSDYIAQVKIEEAKKLIDTHQYLIYEVADMLGFDNAYYFSKVFRKVTGQSPREYEQSGHGF